MNLILYQAYYDNNQLPILDSTFTPYDNTENAKPELREYPMWKNLLEKHKDTDVYWGLLSWRWMQKTELPSSEFRDWILANPDYDVYHMDPSLEVTANYVNLWVQGDQWHPGMLKFANRLFPKIGITEKAEELVYKSDDFATCNYYIGNSKFWTEWLTFLDNTLEICRGDGELYNYLYREGKGYNGSWIPFFSFVTERLLSIFLIQNRHIKVKKFPVEHPCYAKRFGSQFHQFVEEYKRKND